MDDSVNQSQPPRELGERLLRRHREPVGVVDTRHAQGFYERTADWVAQRFALLDHWKTRYEGDATAAVGGQLVLGRHSFQSSAPVVSEPVLSFSERPMPTPIAAPVSTISRSAASSAPAAAVPASSSSPPQQYRVRRPNIKTSPVDSGVSSNMNSASSNTRMSFDQTSAPQSSSLASSRTDETAGVLVETPLRAVESTRPSAVESMRPSTVESMRPSAVESAPLRVQRQTAKIDGAVNQLKEARGPSPLPLRNQPEPAQTNEPLRGQTLSEVVELAGNNVNDATIAPVVPKTRPAFTDQQERAVTSEIRVTPGRPAAPAILRRTQTERSPPPPPPQPPSNNTVPELDGNPAAIPLPSSTESPQSRPLPRSHELPPSTQAQSNGLLQMTTLPLRINRSAQATSEGTMLRRAADVAPGQTPAESIMREATSSESVMRQASSAATGDETQAGSIDLDHLAEQVGRLLSKQLAVERERRGIKGWS